MTREEILPIAKPILFNTDMVRAIPDGRKTATRRIAKNIISFDDQGTYFNVFRRGEWTGPIARDLLIETYAPCKIGDYLYVREAWSERSFGYVYKAYGEEIDHLGNVIKWRPSIHMPKEAARIFLRVTDVRVERLQDISNEQVLKEGISKDKVKHYLDQMPEQSPEWVRAGYIIPFSELWNSTIQKKNIENYGWESNPWVWVIEFERVEVQ